MAVKMQFGRLASIGKKSADGAWIQTFLSPCTPDGVVTGTDVVRAYADVELLLTYGQICAVQSAKEGDKIDVLSNVTLQGKDYKKGDKYTYDSDSTRILGVGMSSIKEIQAQLDRLVRMNTRQLPSASAPQAAAFQITENVAVEESIEA